MRYRNLIDVHVATCVFLMVCFMALPAGAQSNDDCMMCHEDSDATGTRSGQEISVFIDHEVYLTSVHAEMDCIDCHGDLAGVELPHAEDVEGVDCAMCHDDVAEEMAKGPHAKLGRGSELPARACVQCHGNHAILPSSNEASRTNITKLDSLCGTCHKSHVRSVAGSVHGQQGRGGAPAATCVDCHSGHDVISPVKPGSQLEVCGTCHAKQAREHARSLHGRAAAKGDKMAPSCVSCHGDHAIRAHRDPNSPTATINTPALCGQCHHEGTEVSLQHDIPQTNILENYSLSIHGEGLFKKGLTVTAVCTSCHTSHDILEHTHPESSIARENVADTCMQCHARIEEVHLKVIEGRLWEEEPNAIPSCAECHSPHKIRRSGGAPIGAANAACFRCHSDQNLTIERDGETVSLFVDSDAFAASMHSNTACAQCHTTVQPNLKRPCSSITKKVDCSVCHAEQGQLHASSVHGILFAEGDPDAPGCLDCHDNHATEGHRFPTSPTYPRNVPELCGKCHRQGAAAAERLHSEIPAIVDSYEMSIHGKGLVESGLVVSATCTDCHTAHHPQSAEHEDSAVNPANIAATCGKCHHGIEETFSTSVHWPGNTETDKKLPTCEDCHTSHTIARTDVKGFRLTMMNQCGRCHTDEADTFFETYHGKVTQLGSEGAAKCYDCHGTHNILPISNPDSMLSHDNVVGTCAKCHPGAHRKFAGYLTHATHHDPDKYPYLFYAFWFMTTLLVSTLIFATLHTLAWLFRLWRTRDQWEHHKPKPGEKLYKRFTTTQRWTHLLMLLSFFTLALTGMTLKFSYMDWATVLSKLMGGYAGMGLLHRIGAVVLFAVFFFHFSRVFMFKRNSGKSWLAFIFGKNSMMFTFTDIKQIYQSIKWFLGVGERPNYGRFTYWEKFDYFAVVWGVFIIGGTGLLLWFPEFFTRILPGWTVNVATIIHSDEALLAVGFIFTIHFFNTHFRPDKFPMDTVIFNGRVTLEELKQDKPEEYADFINGRTMEEVEKDLVDQYPPIFERWFKIFGFTALGIGLTLIGLITYAMIYAYK